MKRILYFLVFAMLIGIMPDRVLADDTKLKIVQCESDGFLSGAATASENAVDGDEDSVALINTSISDRVHISLESAGRLSRIRIAVCDFPAWGKVEKVIVTVGDSSEEITVKHSGYGVAWAEKNIKTDETDELTLTVKSTPQNKVAAISEIELYGAGAEAGETAAARELEYGKDFSIKAKSQALGSWEYDLSRCHDKNSRTVGGLANLTDGFIVYEFQYPTDVTEIKFSCVLNNDWAVPREVELKAYNEDVVYRIKRTNPDPIGCGALTMQNAEGMQSFELGDDGCKRITHLIVEFNDAYISSTNAKWGAWREIEIYGIPHGDARPTSEIIDTELRSNVEILCDMGIVDGEPTEQYMQAVPRRIDMAKAVLRLTGEYDKAASYVGTYNFSDADADNYNLLSYIYAYKCFGIEGGGDNKFMPYELLTARACYKIILSYLGYSYGKDFKWDDLHELCYALGIGDMIYEESFTNKDMCNAIYESFNVPLKNTDEYFVDVLYSAGRIPDTAWKKISDKQDRITPILEGDYEMPDTVDRNGDFSFTYNEQEHILTPAAFCYNAPFHYAGIYYGTLPKSDPRSKREEFAKALERAGARALRFPGGTPAHQYLIEGEEYTVELYRKTVDMVGWSGLYNPDDYNNAWYVKFYDYMDFCTEYNIEPVFQMNPSFFVDDKGVLRQAYPFRALKATDAGVETAAIYDHDRIEEAIAAFERNLDDIVERGYKIKYWELGNEDNFSNYSALPLSDPNNPLTQDFLQAIAGYARAIKARFPDAHIIVCSGFPYKELMAPEDFALLTAVTKHYPYGRWTTPPADEKTSAARLVRTNEQNFPANYSKEKLHADQAAGNLIIDDTETMAWRFEGWDPSSLQNTFAQALNTAHNWGELVFDTGFIGLNVMHDLGSPFFGAVEYDVCMDPGSRYFRWNSNTSLTVHRDDIPDMFIFEEAYYFSPASCAFELLGEHVGGRVLTNSRSNVDRYISGYASVDDSDVMFTIVNRFNEPIPVNIALPNIKISAQTAEAHILQSNYLRAVLEVEYNNITEPIAIKGNADDADANAIEFEAMPQSVTHFSVKFDNISGSQGE